MKNSRLIQTKFLTLISPYTGENAFKDKDITHCTHIASASPINTVSNSGESKAFIMNGPIFRIAHSRLCFLHQDSHSQRWDFFVAVGLVSFFLSSHQGYSEKSENKKLFWSKSGKFQSVVLVSAGIELIFFLVAGTVLCFGLSVRMMLITH